MSDIKSTLLLALINDSDVAALVGSRVHPLRMPQKGQLPAVIYQLVSSVPISSLTGDSGLDNIRMQITSWAKTYSQAIALSLAVRKAIENSAALKAVTVMEIDTEDQETRSYGIITDYSMWSAFTPGSSLTGIAILDDDGNVVRDDDGNIITN